MADLPIKVFQFDELPTFAFTIKDEDGNVINLSSPDATAIKCFIRNEADAANKFSGGDVDGTFIDKANGRVDWAIPDGGIDTSGSYSGQVFLTFAAGEQQTERFRFTVEAGLRVTT